MFESWTQWHWVFFAWGQVIFAYIVYGIYLYKRNKQIQTIKQLNEEQEQVYLPKQSTLTN